MINLYSGTNCLRSHVCRLIMLAKEAECEFRYVDERFDMSELAQLNPYSEVPTLVDRDFVIYGELVLLEFLDERLPLPSLLPTDPISRARLRLMLYRLRRDWFTRIYLFERTGQALTKEQRTNIQNSMLALLPFFEDRAKSFPTEIDLIDFYMAPFLWRLSHLGIELPEKQSKPILAYAEKLFAWDTFKQSLTDAERKLQQ